MQPATASSNTPIPKHVQDWLTKKGVRRTAAAMHGLAALGVEPDVISRLKDELLE